MSLYTPNNNKPLFLLVGLTLLIIVLLIVPIRPTQWDKDEPKPSVDSPTIVIDSPLVDSVVERTVVSQDTQTLIIPATDSTVADTLVQIDTVIYQETLAVPPVPITTIDTNTAMADTAPVAPIDSPSNPPETAISGAFLLNVLVGLLLLIGLGILLFRIISKRWEKQYWLQYNAKLAPIKRAENLPTLDIDFDAFEETTIATDNDKPTPEPTATEDTKKPSKKEPKEPTETTAVEPSVEEALPPAPTVAEKEPSFAVKAFKEVSTRPLRIVWAIGQGIKSIFSFFSEDSNKQSKPIDFKWQDGVSFVFLLCSWLCYSVVFPYQGEQIGWYGFGFLIVYSLPALLRLHWGGGVVGILIILVQFIGVMIVLILRALEGAEPSTDDTPWLLYIGGFLSLMAVLIFAARRGWLTFSNIRRLAFWSIIISSAAFLWLPHWVHFIPALEEYIYIHYYGIFEFHYMALDTELFGFLIRLFIFFVVWRITASIFGEKASNSTASTNDLTANNSNTADGDTDDEPLDDSPLFTEEALEQLFNTEEWWKKTPLQHLDTINMSDKDLDEESPFIQLYLPDCINVKKLYLAKNNFQSLPFEITELDSLEVLDLSQNQIKTVIPDIAFLKNLEELDLSYNQLSVLPREIAQLSNLKVLNLIGNPLTAEILEELAFLLPNTDIILEETEEALIARLEQLLEEELKAPESVQRIWNKLDGQLLKKLPHQLFRQFTNLMSLSLHGNHFIEIPEVLYDLDQLTELSLNSNPITTIPADLEKIEQLQFLDISATSIERFEANPKALKTLIYDYTKMDKVPEFIFKFEQLEALSLYGNQLKSVPTDIKALQALTYLNLGDNPLQTSVLILAILPQLRSLQLSKVGWGDQKTPLDLQKLTQIKRLNLSQNQYNKLPKDLLELTQLESLSLSDNNLQKLNGNIHLLSNLCYLELANNNLKELPTSIQQLKQLRILDLLGNPIAPKHYQELKAWLPYTEILVDEASKVVEEIEEEETPEEEHNEPEEVETPEEELDEDEALVKKVKALLGEKLKHPKSITYMSDFFYTKLPDLPASIMKQFTNLRSLACYHNPFNKIPEAIFDLTTLESLLLNKAGLKKVPDEIGQLKKLKSLELPYNSIKSFSPKLKELPLLKLLNLKSNGLTEIPSIVFELSNLETLILGSNHILRVPEKLKNLQNLKLLNIGFAGLSNIPDVIFELKNLHTLELSGNDIREIPEGLTKLTKLKSLSLGYNDNIQPSFEGLKKLTTIRQLHLGGIELKTKDLEKLLELTHIEDLWIGYGKVSNIPSTIENMSNLRLLSLTKTGLTKYPEMISKAPNLETLYLNNNNLSSLPPSIKELKKLRRMDLSENNFGIQEKRKIQRMLPNVEIKF